MLSNPPRSYFVRMDTLVSTDWLSRHLADPDLIVLDCSVRSEDTPDGIRNSSGFEDYTRGHIPGAGFADLKGSLCDAESPVEFAVPGPGVFAAAMEKLGVGDLSRVVLYDNSMSIWAARVWWMLRWVGFDKAAILDGGLGAWTTEGRPLSTELPVHPAARFTPRPRPELIADSDEVRAAIDSPGIYLIDTLPEPSFRGEMPIYGRPGHIPTAINIPGLELFDETGHFKPKAELAAMHPLDQNARAITYCGGGILASASAFAMTRLGFDNVAVYTASLQEWAADHGNPMTVAASI